MPMSQHVFELENAVNDAINTMRRVAGEAQMSPGLAASQKKFDRGAIEGMRRALADAQNDPGLMLEAPKLREMARRLDVQWNAFQEGARLAVEDENRLGLAEARPKIRELAESFGGHREALQKSMKDLDLPPLDPGQDEPGSASAPQAPARTPSDVLSSPYAGMEPRHVVQTRDGPDPIAKAKETPPSEVAGATSIEAVTAAAASPEKSDRNVDPESERSVQTQRAHAGVPTAKR